MKKIFLCVFVLAFAIGLFAKDITPTLDLSESADNKVVIQKAIDDCSASGGGTVFINANGNIVYSTGPIMLKSNVELNIARNTTLKAIPIKTHLAFIYAKEQQNVSVTGGGVIDGTGEKYIIKDGAPGRAQLVLIRNCKDVRVKDVRLINSSAWTLYLDHSDTVFVDGVFLRSLNNWNNDAIDIQSRNVVISNCIIDCDDDGICPKSYDPTFPVENITVTNCVIASNCNPIKLSGGCASCFRNITISNCVIKACSESNIRNWNKVLKNSGIEKDITNISGINLQAGGGGYIENVNISNITMYDVQTPLYIRVYQSKKAKKAKRPKSYIQNVTISGITAVSESWWPNIIASAEENALKNITLRDCYFNVKACGNADVVAKMIKKMPPEAKDAYPENRTFGFIPAYGFFLRRVDNLTMDNVQVAYHNGKELRPFILGDKVTGLRMMNCIWQKPDSEVGSFRWVNSEEPYQFNNKEKTTPFLSKSN